ncbi:MAG: sugar transferase [Acetanaerobacterium sp.]
MLARNINDLPANMHGHECKRYLDLLQARRGTLACKRALDALLSALGLAVLLPLFLIVALLVGATSQGGVLFVQERIGQNMRPFHILKFRTMRPAKTGSALALTTKNDARITAVGRILRKVHLDELPQLLNVLRGDMSIVGPRPEVPRYVSRYTDRYLATLLVPPGITCTSSIHFRNENDLLKDSVDAEKCYLDTILPAKMAYNLSYISDVRLSTDIKIVLRTAWTVFTG